MNILQAARDPNLFAPYLGANPATWRAWTGGILPCIFGLKVDPRCRQMVQDMAHRNPATLPLGGFKRNLILCGRRSGKSKISGLVAAYLAAMSGLEKQLSPGERGFVACLAPSKEQAEITRQYIRGCFQTPLLQAEVVDDTRDRLVLRNGVEIRTFAGSFRTSRGFTLLAAVVDEICFFRHSEDCELTARELIRAVRPALVTVKGSKLVAIGSKYSMDGWAYDTWKTHWATGTGGTLIWDAPTVGMNPTIPQSEIDDAIAEDPESARSEYLGMWREDVAAFIPRPVVEALVVKGRQELLPRPDLTYAAFCDVSGGRADDAALGIGHRSGGKVIIDLLRRYRPPFDPQAVIVQMTEALRQYRVRRIVGDNYAAEFTARAFTSRGIFYLKSDKPKAALYLELLPRLCSGEIELPDNEVLINQLATLERRTRSGGRDIVDHPRGGHDDLANCIAGLAVAVAKPTLRAGAFFGAADETNLGRQRLARAVETMGIRSMI